MKMTIKLLCFDIILKGWWRRLLPLLFASIVESPQRLDNGTFRSSSEVIDHLYMHTLSCSFHLGVDSAATYQPNRACETASLQLRVDREKTEFALQMMHEILVCSQLASDRVFIAASKILKLLEDKVHDGDNVAMILLRRLLLTEESNYNTFDQIRMRLLFDEVVHEFSTKKESILQTLEHIRNKVCDASNIR